MRRVEQRDPDEAFGPRHVLADVRDRNVAELPAVLVGDAVDQHGRFPDARRARMEAFARSGARGVGTMAHAILIETGLAVVAVPPASDSAPVPGPIPCPLPPLRRTPPRRLPPRRPAGRASSRCC